LIKEAIGWSEGFFEWQAESGERGAVCLSLTVADEGMVLGVNEYTSEIGSQRGQI
jgi:hypothetical protein